MLPLDFNVYIAGYLAGSVLKKLTKFIKPPTKLQNIDNNSNNDVIHNN